MISSYQGILWMGQCEWIRGWTMEEMDRKREWFWMDGWMENNARYMIASSLLRSTSYSLTINNSPCLLYENTQHSRKSTQLRHLEIILFGWSSPTSDRFPPFFLSLSAEASRSPPFHSPSASCPSTPDSPSHDPSGRYAAMTESEAQCVVAF